MGQLCGKVKHAVNPVPAEHFRHPFTVGYVGLNRFQIGMPVLILMKIDIDDAISVFEQAPLQNRSKKSGSSGNNVSLHSISCGAN
jgi:hypothetical protein